MCQPTWNQLHTKNKTALKIETADTPALNLLLWKILYPEIRIYGQ